MRMPANPLSRTLAIILAGFSSATPLAAELPGNHREGRIYTIVLIAEDPAGNRSEPCEVNVVVPHDRKL